MLKKFKSLILFYLSKDLLLKPSWLYLLFIDSPHRLDAVQPLDLINNRNLKSNQPVTENESSIVNWNLWDCVKC
jgi:hypothetical protein